jgi:hypothetical protein
MKQMVAVMMALVTICAGHSRINVLIKGTTVAPGWTRLGELCTQVLWRTCTVHCGEQFNWETSPCIFS